MLRYRAGSQTVRQPVVLTWDRSISASVERVWAVISDPYAMARTEPHAKVVATYGAPGEVGSRYSIVSRWTPGRMERQVVEAVVGELLVLHQITDGIVIGEQRGALRRAGDTTLLTWTVIEPPLLHPLVHRMSALSARVGVPRWLARLEREVTEGPE